MQRNQACGPDARTERGPQRRLALANGGSLPGPAWNQAVELFGQHGTNELIYLFGL
ncbi:hypothetical protein [Novosphingopyxis iocasae]|uniref:hypothetical protein n=1 Tax=Novosphingopyxis iocasae TaxID=2762729 RepID=UPI0016512663|nr:hypothetical protein [Novosphingopyxis iocasae]